MTMTMKLKTNALENVPVDIFRKAAIRTLNKVAKSTESLANKSMREIYNIKRSDIDPNISIRPASITRLESAIHVKGKRLPIALFGARQNRKGTSVEVIHGQRKLLAHRFVAVMKSGHKGVYARKGKARLPIQEVTTLSVADMFLSRKINDILDKHVEAKLPEVLNREVSFALTQAQ